MTESKKKKEQDWKLINIKVKKKYLPLLAAKAEKLAGGNCSKLLLRSALERQEKIS